MLTLFRKSEFFKKRIDKKLHERCEKLTEEQRKEVVEAKKIEDEREEIFSHFEEELRILELKFDKLLCGVSEKKNNYLKDKPLFSHYWLRVFSNHKMLKDFIAEDDKDVLKCLVNLRSEKLQDGNSFKLVFEFSSNDYFTNSVIEKTYNVSKDLLIDSINSTPIEWKEGKNLTTKKVSKTLKNKNTGEKKTVEKEEVKPSFFNFFTNLRLPSTDEVKSLDFDVEKELGAHLDMEYELGVEIVDELIPYSVEYFVGVSHDSEEFGDYMHERTIESQEKKKK